MSKHVEITGILLNERRPPNCENFFIARVRLVGGDSDGLIVEVVGNCEEGDLQSQLTYRFWGSWKESERFGRQFAVATFVMAAPHGRQGVIRYLEQNCDGIGRATAEQLWNKFNADAVRVCREAPEVVASAIKRLSIEQCQKISEQLEAAKAMESVSIELIDFFAGMNVPKSVYKEALRRYGNKAVELFRLNPWLLLGFRGISYLKADAIYSQLGLPPDRLKRQIHCLNHEMKGMEDTWISDGSAKEALAKKISGVNVNLDKAVSVGIRAKKFATTRRCQRCVGSGRAKVPDLFTGETMVDGPCISCRGTGGPRWIALQQRATNERIVAEKIAALLRTEPQWPDVGLIKGVSDHQRAAMANAFNGSLSCFIGGPGTGKAQPLNANVLTPGGWKSMGNMQVGDQVICPEGGVSRVVGVYPQGPKQVYRVHFSDKTWAECCDEHLWLTQTRRERKRKKQAEVRSLNEISRTLDRGDGSANHSIPMVGKIDTGTALLTPAIDPYLLGLLIGDGSFVGKSPQFSTGDPELAMSLATLLPVGCELSSQKDGRYDYRVHSNGSRPHPLIQLLSKLGLWGLKSTSKFIPDDYLFADRESRIALLQGLLDTDGFCEKGGVNIEYSTSSPWLAHQYVELVQSLGGTASVACRITAYTHGGERRLGQKSWRILTVLPNGIDPFRLKRKASRYRPRSKYPPRRRIVKIETKNVRPCQCISIDNPSGLYITDNYIVTHNTHAISALTTVLIDAFGSENVAAASPTNKAAVRLTQGFRANDIDISARSIHSLLGVEKVEDGNWSFRHSRANPFPYRVILLDEQSMLSTDLAACLFDAILPGTLVLMIGDTGQLPPIQHGAVLRDMLATNVSRGELTEPQRNAGDLVFACQDIKNGRRFRESDQIDLGQVPPKNFKFITARNPEEQIGELYVLLDWAKENGLDPVWDCQVMSAVNRTSKVSKDELNKLLQERFNPGDQSAFRVRDKVICDDNGFYAAAGGIADDGDFSPPDDSDGKVFIAKGEFGQVTAVAKKDVTVRFDGENRTVRLPLGIQRRSSIPADGGATESSCPISLAYSCTVHRMQGSECKLAIPMIDESAGARWLGCRELFFTAISRGKLLTRPIGNRSTADHMCKKVSIGKRKTFLTELIREYSKGWQPAEELSLPQPVVIPPSASTELAEAGLIG